MSVFSKGGDLFTYLCISVVGAVLSLVLMPSIALAQTPIGDLQTAATTAATQAVGLVVAVVLITLAVVFGLWAIRKARSG